MNPVITEGSTAIQVMDIITIAFTIAPHIIRVTTTADTTTADTTVTIAIMSIPRMMIKPKFRFSEFALWAETGAPNAFRALFGVKPRQLPRN
jgi:hypothetical protein